MAKVESLNSSSSFYVNNSSFPGLNFGLEINENCSSKYDFDISLLLSDNETRLEKQGTDNDNCIGKKSDNKEGRCSSQNSLNKPESSKFASLDVLAENHLKKNKMLSELSFGGDFSLSDLLSNDNCPIASNSKNIPCENDDLFELCLLTEDGNCIVEKKSGAKNDISFDDLSDWMNSSITQASDSLEFFHNHFSPADTEGKLENISSVPFKINTKHNTDSKVSECLDGVQGKSRYADNISDVDLVNILSEVSSDSSETNVGKYESTNEVSDSDFLPDIDLTFCIKKDSKNNFSSYGNSPETVDSGFDESDFFPDKLSIPSEGNSFCKDISVSESGTGNKNVKSDKVKQNLFSRAISAKPKIDDSKKSKLKNVMNGLLKGLPLMHCVKQINTQGRQKAIDHSNENIVISSYLKF